MNIKIINSTNGTVVAEKRTNFIPRAKENIRIDGTSYEVIEVMHDFDKGCIYIAVKRGVTISYVNHYFNN